MDRRDFEKYVAKLLKKKGWKRVRVGKGRSDGGIDVSGYLDGEKWIVQCKRYKINSSIGVNLVRETFGVAESLNAKAMVATTGYFTNAAKKFAKKNKVLLWN